MSEIKKEFLIDRQGKTFVLYAGLLDLAHNQGLKDITTSLVQTGTEDNGQTWMFRADVVTATGHFTGYGDANPTNVSRQMLTVLPRMAETRAKARALRDAVNVGVAALEELGEESAHDEPRQVEHAAPISANRPTAPPSAPRPVAAPTNGATGHLASEAQVSAIYAIGKGLKKSRDDMDAWIFQTHARMVTDLTRQEASQLITALKEQQATVTR